MAKSEFRVGVLTGGGDTPALNATVYGIVEAAKLLGGEVIGFRKGWAGLLLPDKEYVINGEPIRNHGEYVFLNSANINPNQGGSIILSSRTDLSKIPGAYEDVDRRLRELSIDYFLPIGGDDTTSVAFKVKREGALHCPIMAVPKTIDNDNGRIGPKDVFEGFEGMTNTWVHGFPSAVANGREYADSTYSTAYSHERVMWIEAMGRKAGFLALAIGNLGLADMIIIPEDPIDIEDICRRTLEVYRQKGYFYGVISEGAVNSATGMALAEDKSVIDTFGHGKLGGAAKLIAKAVEDYFKKHGISLPYSNGQIPEYVYRGGPPEFLDGNTAKQSGYNALMSLVNDSSTNGHMAVLLLRGGGFQHSTMPLEDAVKIDESGKIVPRTVPVDRANPGRGFYNPNTKNITEQGKEYVRLLQIPPIEFTSWNEEVHK